MNRTVLVVDDDLAMQVTIAGILEDEGYAVLVAGDGIDALDRLTATRPDAIVLDISMPRMDGFAFADELSRRGLRAGLPVIVLTADGRAQEKAARLGADGYLAKPFALDDLLSEVARCLG